MTELLPCPEFEAWWEQNWGKQKHTANYTDANRAAFIAGMKARAPQQGERKLVEALGLIACRPLGGKTEDYFCAKSLQDIAQATLKSYQEGKL